MPVDNYRFWENDDSSNDGSPNVILPTMVCLLGLVRLGKQALGEPS